MGTTIIFGSKRLGKSDAQVSNEKYPELAVVTVEAIKGAKKSRRILFNAKAAEKLNLIAGDVQSIVFGTMMDSNTGAKSVLIANEANLDHENSEGLTMYNVSKNRVGVENTKEKFKSISSNILCGDIVDFLNLNNACQHEFTVGDFEGSVDAVTLNYFNPDNESVDENALLVKEAVAIDNSGNEISGEQMRNSVQNEVQKQEDEALQRNSYGTGQAAE
jgi:plastocyanin